MPVTFVPQTWRPPVDAGILAHLEHAFAIAGAVLQNDRFHRNSPCLKATGSDAKCVHQENVPKITTTGLAPGSEFFSGQLLIYSLAPDKSSSSNNQKSGASIQNEQCRIFFGFVLTAHPNS
jgi:hypothetical protein